MLVTMQLETTASGSEGSSLFSRMDYWKAMQQFVSSSGLHANICVSNKPDWFVCGEAFCNYVQHQVHKNKCIITSHTYT